MMRNLNHKKFFSIILEINGRLEIERTFFSSLRPRLGFFEKRRDDSTFENLGEISQN